MPSAYPLSHPEANVKFGCISQICVVMSLESRVGAAMRSLNRLLPMWPGFNSELHTRGGLSLLVLYSTVRGIQVLRFFLLKKKTKLDKSDLYLIRSLPNKFSTCGGLYKFET